MNEEQIREHVLEIIQKKALLESIDLSDTFSNIGIDYFDFNEIIMDIEDKFDVCIEDSWYFGDSFDSISGFIDWIVAKF